MTFIGAFKSDDKLHVQLLLFVFLTTLQKEMMEFLMRWNSHKVRQLAAGAIGGVHVVLFQMLVQ